MIKISECMSLGHINTHMVIFNIPSLLNYILTKKNYFSFSVLQGFSHNVEQLGFEKLTKIKIHCL